MPKTPKALEQDILTLRKALTASKRFTTEPKSEDSNDYIDPHDDSGNWGPALGAAAHRGRHFNVKLKAFKKIRNQALRETKL